ncbi:MAG: class D beta-lactamase [Desulfobulbaceae bacterium]|nr:MAG: class D beta-lactamase [Desulfobulbaceae bacterium]
MKSLLIYLILLPSFCSCFAGVLVAQDTDLEQLFRKSGIEGTIIISSLDGTQEFVHNRTRAEQRFLPASTFKIPHSLIALDEQALRDQNEVIPWDGIDKGWQRWNKDQTLVTALPDSCIWFYQELATRIGNASYLTHLGNIEYGNMKTGSELTTFWLNGDLAVSAREQIQFLKKLYHNELPYSRNHLELVKKLLIVKSTPDAVIRAKTGWAMRIENQHGWYVGYVEKKDETWFFATNIAIKKKQDSRYREVLTLQALKVKKIL